MARRSQHGFTLIEILVVVIILGILAAIMIPMFQDSTDDARKATLLRQLHTLRSQIQIYSIEHEDTFPAINAADWSPLVTRADIDGRQTGPYLQQVPRNALNSFTNIAVIDTNPNWGDAVDGEQIGFVYNSTNGLIWATNKAGNRVYNESNPNDPNN